MGTNYYWIKNPCRECGRSDERLHIGKSSSGWEFSFQGLSEPTIRSYRDWLWTFASEPGQIIDEYERKVPLEDLLALIRLKKGGLNHSRLALGTNLNDAEKQYMADHPTDFNYYRIHGKAGIDNGDDWTDQDGNSFSSREFS